MPEGMLRSLDAIIDVYHKNDVDFGALESAKILGIIHKASQGVDVRDEKYRARRDQALKMGFLWGAYHFSSADDVKEQVKLFLDVVEWGKNPDQDSRTLLSLDFEPSDKKIKKDKNGKPVLDDDGKPIKIRMPDMTLDQANEFVVRIHERTGRWPMVYGGGLLRKRVANADNKIPLARCPLWYSRYNSTPKGLPVHIWPTFTLWQYSNGKDGPKPRDIDGEGYDRDTFIGTDANLKSSWPFVTA
ncbi:glycoside hydrolase family 25 protein [Caballeronia sp. 15711]|uniref:glycoside hydrolase family 25 protein n=1 Tax=Caballeronia sp. 15711 TaxID=3391029 RepID=UPI0039E4907A